MRYIFFTSEDEKYWIEINDNNIAYRQIIFSNGAYHVSALEDCLAEGKIIEEEFEENIIEITNEEFEIIWNDSLKSYRQTWNSIKHTYLLNNYITAKLMYFYPQGAIFKIDNIIINYIGNEEVKIHEELKMKIVGYDDSNMWIIAR